MNHIFIIGSRGYKAKYGGWETFVTKLVSNYDDKNTIFHISGLSDVTDKLDNKITENIITDYFNVNKKGGVQMLLCTIKAFNYYVKYIKEENITNTYIYILGLKLGPLLIFNKNKLKKLGITTIVNPDGLEHERSKWSYPVKKYFLLSERWMLKNSDIIICDAKGIKEYIDNKYPNQKNKTIYIAYGTDKVDLSQENEEKVLLKYNLTKENYILMVGRFVPENNYELVIKEYINSDIKKDLIIISNISSSNYYNEILEKTNCLKDKRIKFIDGVYDEKKLSIIRKNALAYIHGHSVGGTNPSLLEALSLTKLNILYDVNFNKDVGLDSCLYFKEEGTLTSILNSIEKYDRNKLGNKAKTIIERNYTWKIIVNKYKKIFNQNQKERNQK